MGELGDLKFTLEQMAERAKAQQALVAFPSPTTMATVPGAGSWDPVTLPHRPHPAAPRADQDGAEPSANSVSAHNLLRLHGFTGHKDWMDKCVCLLTAFSERMRRVPVALPEMVCALSAHQQTLKQVCVCGGG